MAPRARRSTAVMETFDPGRAVPHAEFAAGDADDRAVGRRSGKARRAKGHGARMLPRERRRTLTPDRRMELREHSERLAIAEVLDSGKTINEARGDVLRRGALLRLLRRRGRQERGRHFLFFLFFFFFFLARTTPPSRSTSRSA